MSRRNGSENPLGGVNLGRYGSGWGRLGTEEWSCSCVPRRLDRAVKRETTSFGKRVRTFVFRGGPELGQFGSVRPIELGLQMDSWAVRPRLSSSGGRRAPKNKNVVFGRVGAREGISNDDFGCIWINCTETSEGDVGGRIDDGREDKVCGEQNQEGVDRACYD